MTLEVPGFVQEVSGLRFENPLDLGHVGARGWARGDGGVESVPQVADTRV